MSGRPLYEDKFVETHPIQYCLASWSKKPALVTLKYNIFPTQGEEKK